MTNSFKGKEVALRLDVVSTSAETLGTNAVKLECVRAIFTSDNERSINWLLDCLLEGILIDLCCVTKSVTLTP